MADDEYAPLRREYAGLARRYDSRWRVYVESSARETLRRLMVAPGERLLDIGCGTGVLLGLVSHTTPDVRLAGLDLSTEMLAVARRRLGAGVDLRQAPAEALPFPDASFDAVVSTSVFHFIRSPGAALREMRRVLKPAGRVVVTDWCRDYLTCRLLDLWLRARDPAHVRTYGVRELRGMLAQTGFGDLHIARYKIDRFWGLMTATARCD